jgi:prephenate dehydrogenase
VLFERAAIIGVGLIGGSLGGAAKRAGLIGEVVGVGRGAANLEVARQRGFVDRTTSDLAEIGPVDLVVLAVPVLSTGEVARALRPHLRPGTVVSDAASVKGTVVAALEAICLPECPVVGAHPIAGSEQSGAAAGREDLFVDSVCVLTPTPRTDAAALERVAALWRGVGARVEQMEPAAHDRALAMTSHLVHAIAYALAKTVGDAGDAVLGLAGPSLRDATRVAASRAELWRDIFDANRGALLEAVDTFAACLLDLREAIARGDDPTLLGLLEEARKARKRLESGR